jgi:hypothetical protein
MQILILTPLFPPDTGNPAEYAKELSLRLAREHTVTTLIYGHLPEAVANVRIEAIDKRAWLPKRLFLYTLALHRNLKKAELVIINNAPSTELPALLMSWLNPRTMILCESDSLATSASKAGLYRFVHNLLIKRVKKTIEFPSDTIYKRAEVLPFEATNFVQEERRETWWSSHLHSLLTTTV